VKFERKGVESWHMDIKPPPDLPTPAPIVCNKPHDGPHSAHPVIVLTELPVMGYTIDSGGSIQGGAIPPPEARVDWK
jgi:hypothetical protein